MATKSQSLELTIRNAKGVKGETNVISCGAGLELWVTINQSGQTAHRVIGFGKSVQTAFEQAKAALMLENIPEEETPVLFLQEGIAADNFVLVEPVQNSRTP